ncbi:MAG: hypothetical protein U0X92_14620 [Anaerolineales bacterium]
MVLPNWAHNATILLVMQHVDNHMKFRIGRSPLTLFRRGLVAKPDADHRTTLAAGGHGSRCDARVRQTHQRRGDGINHRERLHIPTTARLRRRTVGQNAEEGVVDENFEIRSCERPS